MNSAERLRTHDNNGIVRTLCLGVLASPDGIGNLSSAVNSNPAVRVSLRSVRQISWTTGGPDVAEYCLPIRRNEVATGSEEQVGSFLR